MSDEDIVDLLREHANDEGMLGNDLLARCLWDAADEIERLRAECDRWHDVANSLATHIEKTSSGNARALQEYDNMVYKAVYRD